ncbi:hypothetical protein LX16_4619 [Stackebrandtia albiflava]|uniref:Uncharacterized protein n=2 Tax=Stackebrandtia albiflava TaxID=406432 RepID=A0A562UQE3_9ACTN|nr:hypothetical protein LX16_4619 [Stackebrandtia albiflava]
MEHVMAVSTVSGEGFWDGLRRAYVDLPGGVAWRLAVASRDGTRAVNILTAASTEDVRRIFDSHVGDTAVTEFFEVDAANAVGL